MTRRKREGDGATPVGTFQLQYGFYRADRKGALPSRLKWSALKKDHGWCDDQKSGRYNCFMRLPTRFSHEILCRDDALYDRFIVLSHNQKPRIRGLGSAIFFHIAHEDCRPTEGCIAVSKQSFRLLAPLLRRGTNIKITA